MRTYMKNVDPSTSGAKLVIRYFPSLSWSFAAAASIARIDTLSLCLTYKLCYTFLRSTTGGRYYTLFLLLLIVRLCPCGRNCRAGYSHFHQLTSPISSSLLLNQQGADWCQNWLSCNSNSVGQDSPCWKMSRTLFWSSPPSTLAPLRLLLLLPACCRVIALNSTPAPTAMAAAVAKRAVF